MPTYEYRCSCGHDFEVFQRMSDPPEADCPKCGIPAERKLSAGAGFLFKGDGFYITDYRSKEYKDAARADSPSNGSSSDDSGSGSKTASGGAATSGKSETSGGSSSGESSSPSSGKSSSSDS